MSLSKVESVLSCESPKSVHDVQVVFGFANFYRRFIINYYLIAAPITELTMGDPRQFYRGDKQEVACKKMNLLFTIAPICCHFKPERRTVVETDASNYALGCVLSLIIEKRLHPVEFHSRKFHSGQLNYEIHDKELPAIVTAFKE